MNIDLLEMFCLPNKQVVRLEILLLFVRDSVKRCMLKGKPLSRVSVVTAFTVNVLMNKGNVSCSKKKQLSKSIRKSKGRNNNFVAAEQTVQKVLSGPKREREALKSDQNVHVETSD